MATTGNSFAYATLEFCLSSSSPGNYTSYHFSTSKNSMPSLSSPSVCLFLFIFPFRYYLWIFKRFSLWGINYLNIALSKLKTYNLNEELLKILKKELEEKKIWLYRMSYSTTLQVDKFTRRRYGTKFHKYHFMKFVYTYGILKIRIATTTRHQRSVQVMYGLERYKIIRQNNVDFLMIQGRFPFWLYKKKINTKTSMSTLLFDEHLINIGVEFNKLQKLMIFYTKLRFEYDIEI